MKLYWIRIRRSGNRVRILIAAAHRELSPASLRLVASNPGVNWEWVPIVAPDWLSANAIARDYPTRGGDATDAEWWREYYHSCVSHYRWVYSMR